MVLVVPMVKVLLMVDLVAVDLVVLAEDRVILHQYHHLKVIVVELVTIQPLLMVATLVQPAVVALAVVVVTVTPTSVVPVVQEQHLLLQVFR